MQPKHTTTEKNGILSVTPVPKYIVVKGEKEYKFAPCHWREALKKYLACVWTSSFSGNETISLDLPTYTPSVGGDGSVHFRYLGPSGEYDAFGMLDQGLPPSFRHVRLASVMQVIATRPEYFESALARFAWDKQMRVLGIYFPNCTHIQKMWLWSYPQGLTVYEEINHSHLLAQRLI